MLRELATGAIAALMAIALQFTGATAKEPPPATQEEILEAHKVLVEWTEAFEAGDYHRQWLLTDARIRYWHDRKRWAEWMKKARGRNGALTSYEIEAAAPATAQQLPCTENGHCFRKNVQYVLFTIRSEYESVEPPQPEFVVMAKSEEGWRFGGGTFLNRPMGETSVIMTVQDERRYKAGVEFR